MNNGPPRINDFLLPYGHVGGGGDERIAYDPDHVYFPGREGDKVKQHRWWPEISFGWAALTLEEYRYIVGAVQSRHPATVIPATPTADSPPGASVKSYTMHQKDKIPEAGQPDVAGKYYSLQFTMRAASWIPVRPPVEGPRNVMFPESVNLFAGVESAPVANSDLRSYRVPFPVAGRLLRLEAPTGGAYRVRVLDEHFGTVSDVRETLDGGGARYVELPPGTHYVEVRTPGPRPFVALDTDTLAVKLVATGEDGYDSYTFETQGEAYWERHEYEHTTVKGNTVTLVDFRLMPGMFGQQRISGGLYERLLTYDT